MTADPKYGGWSYPAFYAGLGLYAVAVVALSIGVDAVAPGWIVGAFWIGALAGLVAVERYLERALFGD